MIVESSSRLVAQSLWPVDRIKDNAVKIGSGVTPSGGAASYLDSGIPLLRSQNVHFDGLRLDDVAYIAEETHEEMSGSKLRVRDVLLNITGASIGRCAFVPDNFGEGNVNQHVCIIRPTAKLNHKFLTYCLSAPWGQDQVFSGFTGASRQGLGQRDLGEIQVPLPPLLEQQRIASYLDASCAAIDAAVTAKRRQLETLDALRKTIIHNATTKGINAQTKNKQIRSEMFDSIPAHWNVDRFKDVALLRNEKTDQASETEDYLELEDMESRTGKILSRRNTLEVESAVTLFEKGDILFGKLRPYLEKYYEAEFDGKCTGEILAFKPTRIRGRFLFYCIASPWFINRCNILAYGAKMPRINWPTQLAQFDLPLPTNEEQDAICAYLDTKLVEINRIRRSIEVQIETLTAYRKSLIHECVTGQRRITEKDLNKVIAHA